MIQPKLFYEEILPQEWLRELQGVFYIFNPGLTRLPQGGFALAFRVVAADGRRRIGICRLDAGLAPVSGSSIPLSDILRPDEGRALPSRARDWFADPR